MRLESDCTPADVLEEALTCGLVEPQGAERFVPTRLGRMLGKAQGAVQSLLTEGAKKVLRDRVYLDDQSGARCCGEFISGWRPDTNQQTFVLARSESETAADLLWLQTLERAGLISVNREQATIKREFLGAVNDLLARLREFGSPMELESDDTRNLVGEIGEELAMEFERGRLRSGGSDWLVPAIQQISLVDRSAGYDILSCRGQGKRPDSLRLIEVKATTSSALRFYWSRNERRVADERRSSYWIYAYTEIDIANRKGKGPLMIQNPASKVRPPAFLVEPLDVVVTRPL